MIVDAPDIFREIDITIEGRPPSLNARPANWQADRRQRDEWHHTALAVAIDARNRWVRRHGLRWRTFERCGLVVTFIVPTRARRDWDNLISTIKPLLDGIVSAGVMADDSDRCISRVDFRIVHEPKRTATRFTFYEIVDDD